MGNKPSGSRASPTPATVAVVGSRAAGAVVPVQPSTPSASNRVAKIAENPSAARSSAATVGQATRGARGVHPGDDGSEGTAGAGARAGAGAGADGAKKPAPASKGASSQQLGGAGMGYVLSDAERKRVLTEFFDVETKESGRGHYGVVRFGIDRSNGEKVAIKTVPKRRQVYVEMLRKEISIVKSMDHVNIIKMIDAFEEEEVVHLVFEPCYGGELFEPIANRQFRFSEFHASVLIRKLLHAVKHCHEKGIVHRDLKPENLLLSAKGVESELKLIDFGLATHVEPEEVLRKHVGTPYYIAPEVLDKAYGLECDLWSIGVILFTMMCGFPPFWGDTEREIYSRIRRGFYAFEGPDWAHRSAGSKDMVNRLLTMNPISRPTVDEALQHPWVVHEGSPHMHPYSRKIFTKLRKFSGFPLLKKIALVVVARSLSDDELAQQLDWYRTFDRNNRDFLAWYTLLDAAHERDLWPSEEEMHELVAGVGVLRRGVITYYEFIAATTPRTVYLNEERIEGLFAAMDANEDGIICVEDLQKVTGRTEDAYAEQILAEADLDDEGFISFSTFLRVYCGQESRCF